MSSKPLKQKLGFLANSFKFTKKDLVTGLALGILFSLFIYFEHFDLNFFLLNSIIAVYVYYHLLTQSQAVLMLTAFFMGLLWFYWVGFSFIYVDMTWAVPFVALFFASGYALSFWFIGFWKQLYVRLPLIFLLSFYNPLDRKSVV